MLKSVFILGFTGFFYLDFGDNYAKTNEDIPTLSATKMFARDCNFWLYKAQVDIRYGYRVKRRPLTVGWSKATNFQFLRATAVPAGTAEARISYGNYVCPSVCLSVRHGPVEKQPSDIETPGLHHMIA